MSTNLPDPEASHVDAQVGAPARLQEVPAIHPFLIALLPVVQLYAANVDFALSRDVLQLIVGLLALTTLLLLLLRFVVPGWGGRALVTSALIGVFFHFSLIQDALAALGLGAALAAALALLVGVALVAAAWWVARDGRLLEPLTQLLNMGAGILLIFFSINILFYFQAPARNDWLGVAEAMVADTLVSEAEVDPAARAAAPDIYYIILDGYGRPDILQALYDLDGSAFLGYLDSQGFQIPSHSRANYPRTDLSLLASLNMQYIDRLAASPSAKEVSNGFANYAPIQYLVENNSVVRSLDNLGYEFILISSGYAFIGTHQNPRADYCYCGNAPRSLMFTEIFNRTPLVLIPSETLMPHTAHREKVRYAFEQLRSMPDRPGPQFVFAHILVPHPPFVFNAEGAAVGNEVPFSLEDASHYEGSTEMYLEGYAAQVRFVDRQLQQVAEAILARSGTPPIIIFQGDHGPGLLWDWEDFDNSYVPERMSIFAAYHLPGASPPTMPDDMTPVNTFRILFNSYFGTDFEMLPNRSFTTGWEIPYEYQPIPPERWGEPLPEIGQ